jgi:alpha-tubulin suppressor-like RCC1 family protein
MLYSGQEHSLFLDTHGRVYACGNGRNGKLGLGVYASAYVSTRLHTYVSICQHSFPYKLGLGVCAY